MKEDTNLKIKRGSKNVFADLGVRDTETRLFKAGLVSRIQSVMDAQKLTQTAAARRMSVSQLYLSRLLNGQFGDVCVERLMHLQAALL